jgi:integrase
VENNPIALVTQAHKRLKSPRVLMKKELKALLAKLEEPFKTMVVTITCLGLRVSELLALQWGDIDSEKLTVKIQRSVVTGEVNPTKTDPSEASLPLDPDLAEVLLQHRARATYIADCDYVFAATPANHAEQASCSATTSSPQPPRPKLARSDGIRFGTFIQVCCTTSVPPRWSRQNCFATPTSGQPSTSTRTVCLRRSGRHHQR